MASESSNKIEAFSDLGEQQQFSSGCVKLLVNLKLEDGRQTWQMKSARLGALGSRCKISAVTFPSSV
jgi:hypothetical protein